MIRRTPRSTRTDTHFPYTTLFRSKSIGGGLPLAGVVGRAQIMDAPAPGGLGGTYGGNPVACAAALAVFEAIEHDNLLECATALGERLRDFIEALQHESALGIGEIRGLAGMSAFALIEPGSRTTPDPAQATARHACAAELGRIVRSDGRRGGTEWG